MPFSYLSCRRREKTCFVAAWTIWALDWQIFNSFLILKRWFQFSSMILKTHFERKWLGTIWKRFQERKLHFQMTFLLSSASSLLKLPTVTRGRALSLFATTDPGVAPTRWALAISGSKRRSTFSSKICCWLVSWSYSEMPSTWILFLRLWLPRNSILSY